MIFVPWGLALFKIFNTSPSLLRRQQLSAGTDALFLKDALRGMVAGSANVVRRLRWRVWQKLGAVPVVLVAHVLLAPSAGASFHAGDAQRVGNFGGALHPAGGRPTGMGRRAQCAKVRGGGGLCRQLWK